MQSRDDDGTMTNVARPPLDNAAHVNLGSGGEQQQQHYEGGTSKNYENGPLPPSPTNENNKRIKTSPSL
jgi:hypothetical protein